MDLAVNCKDKLAYFRIKELKDVLTQLGLSKQGKKQDLVDRILAILSDDLVPGIWAKKNAVRREEVAKLVDDTYRKMQVSGATTDLASKGQGVSDSSNMKFKELELEDSHKMDKVRCLCGSSLQADSMIKCEDSRCNVWQHIGCVLVPDKVTEGVIPAPPDVFYCELCRLNRADPFLVTMSHPLYPVKLSIANRPTDGTNPVQSIEKTFQLTRADKDLLAKPEYDIQAWCMLLNDKVPFRLQWPQHADLQLLQVNGVPVRAINRPGSQLLGANGRDDGPVITPCIRDGMNKISLTRCDARVFCLGVRIIKRRTVQQILNLIPKESDGEIFEDALARVRRCVGGGAATENADSDSDLEVVADSIPVSLRCPMSGSRIKVAGRFKPCVHMGCFDLDIFVEMNQRSRKWQCPICLKNYSLENVIIDPYFNRITSKMRSCGEDVTEIEVKPDGSWRVKAENDRRGLGDITQWHFPNGTLCARTDGEAKFKADTIMQVKQECFSEGHTGLKLGIKKNRNGVWEVSKPDDYSGNRPFVDHENRTRNGIPINSSATGSGRDCDDPSVNQDGGVNIDSVSPNIETVYNFADPIPSAQVGGDAEVIILSDSDEDNELLISSGPVYRSNESNAGRVSYEVPLPEIPTTYPEDPSLGAGGSSCLGLFGANGEEFGPPLWSLASSSQGGPGYHFFGSDTDPLVDMSHGSLNCPPLMNGFTLTGEPAPGSSALVPNSSGHRSTTDINDVLVDNPIVFDGDDPSLHLFLPTRPSDGAIQANMRNQSDVSNNICLEDWTSLTLGGCGSGGHEEPGGVNELNSRQQLPFQESALDSLADTASLLLGMNDNRSNNHTVNGNGPTKLSREKSQSPFLFPRKRRTVRPRLYLSIDSDSE